MNESKSIMHRVEFMSVVNGTRIGTYRTLRMRIRLNLRKALRASVLTSSGRGEYEGEVTWTLAPAVVEG